ncbi:aminopeptidase P family protein [Geitlerinema sp. PCC 9228]|jgi:Xaa-Pro aminopeptidase|uniref:aminopeptidase P family protein n=1 Tax=Geitlerinema sp. PCC 9228 TaxID=111611 RepID=UPI0008F9A9E1|nr:aminopeptidase P family protein [Geitlerinema sp. PCC 9228]
MNNQQTTLDLSTLQQRRSHLTQQLQHPVMLWSGKRAPRNFPANTFPFRASSHFLYFAGLNIENAILRLDGDRTELYVDNPDPGEVLWHGEMPQRDDLATTIGADAAFDLAAASQHAADAATIPHPDDSIRIQQSQLLQRTVDWPLSDRDRALADVIVSLRLCHDTAAIDQLRQASPVTVAAHQAAMAATPHAQTEAEVRAALEGIFLAHNMTPAYSSVVTVQGEVLHNEVYTHTIQPGDLLLADAGAETPSGWASDVTRTWPVSGRFSPTQRDIYDVVLAAHDACIEKAQPGVEYRDLHLLAAHTIAQGLVDLGILRGNPENLVEMDAHALFFPHGVGHLLGLDVHDMEDLGDLAGYAPGRQRCDRFGLAFLRLNRMLEAGMLVTIEPGFYQVPAILNDPQRRQRYQEVVNWERLAQFQDVRGIRIEDDVLITNSGNEVLTADLPTAAAEIEQLVHAPKSNTPSPIEPQ